MPVSPSMSNVAKFSLGLAAFTNGSTLVSVPFEISVVTFWNGSLPAVAEGLVPVVAGRPFWIARARPRND